MSVFEWSDSFLLRIPVIDSHHKHLVTLLNLAYGHFTGKITDVNMNLLVADLIKYSSYHFKVEESLMKEHNYPLFDEHKQLHGIYIKNVLEFQALLLSEKITLELEVLKFLKDWLTDHILNCDKKYGYFINLKKQYTIRVAA